MNRRNGLQFQIVWLRPRLKAPKRSNKAIVFDSDAIACLFYLDTVAATVNEIPEE